MCFLIFTENIVNMKKVLSLILLIFCFSNTAKSQCIDSSLINPFCICPMIYAPVCACNGIAYSNDCLAQCDGNTFWGPVDPTLSPGMPCSLSACDVSIIGDSVPCNYPAVVEAVFAGTSPITQITWTDQLGNIMLQSNMFSIANLFTAYNPGLFHVSIVDSNGCIDSASINMQVMPMTIYSIPNPPNICLGDSIYLIHDTSFVNGGWGSGLATNPTTFYPTEDITYIGNAWDGNGCLRKGEIFVDVDSCVSNTLDMNTVFSIYPNPSKGNLKIENNFNHKYDISFIDITGKSVYYIANNRGSIDLNIPNIESGIYILKVESYYKSIYKKIIIE